MAFPLISIMVLLASVVFADIKFLTPAPGALYAGGATLLVSWADSGIAPSLSDLKVYGINLCAGGNAAGSFDCTLAKLVVDKSFTVTGNSISPVIPAAAGQSISLGYFLQIVSTTSTGAQVTNYSPRFSLNGMTGRLSQSILNGIASIGTTTSGPPSSGEGVAIPAVADGSFAIPYNLQEGLTKYAPMQPVPGSQITAQNASPQWPASSVVKAVTYLPIGSIQTTITQSQTFSVASVANTAAAAPLPMDDMQKFLNRWKD